MTPSEDVKGVAPVTAPEGLLAVDAGQTGVRLRYADAADRLIEGAERGVLTDRPILPQIADIAARFIVASSVRPERVAVGTTGLTGGDRAEDLLGLLSRFGVHTVHLAHDSVTGYLGAVGLRDGVMIAAGTGVVTLAAGIAGVARVDGWGHVIGDAGSAYWIGQHALIAAMRAHDGRGEPTALLPLLQRRWPDPETAYMTLQASPDRVAIVASYARHVDELADHGDAVAQGIRRHAAQALVESGLTALRRAGGARTGARGVALIGGVFQSAELRRGVAAGLERSVPGLDVLTTVGSGLDGAARLSDVRDSDPLSPMLRSARTFGELSRSV